jgi:hypothetical protein
LEIYNNLRNNYTCATTMNKRSICKLNNRNKSLNHGMSDRVHFTTSKMNQRETNKPANLRMINGWILAKKALPTIFSERATLCNILLLLRNKCCHLNPTHTKPKQNDTRTKSYVLDYDRSTATESYILGRSLLVRSVHFH